MTPKSKDGKKVTVQTATVPHIACNRHNRNAVQKKTELHALGMELAWSWRKCSIWGGLCRYIRYNVTNPNSKIIGFAYQNILMVEISYMMFGVLPREDPPPPLPGVSLLLQLNDGTKRLEHKHRTFNGPNLEDVGCVVGVPQICCAFGSLRLAKHPPRNPT